MKNIEKQAQASLITDQSEMIGMPLTLLIVIKNLIKQFSNLKN